MSLNALQPLLTIAIPTYNRVLYLEGLLDILVDQLTSETRVEVIVSDNASIDETPALIQAFQQRGLRLRSIRNATNIGGDANILQCFEQARGKYVWIFGDDDTIAPGGIAAVLEMLGTKEYDLIYINNYPFKGKDPRPEAPLTPKAREFTDEHLFAKRIHVSFTFISSNIINKERLSDAGVDSFSLLVGTNLVQLAWTYAALNGFERGLFIEDKLVGMRVENTGGYRLADVFGSNFKRITQTCLHSHRLQQLIVRGTLQRFLPGLMFKFGKSSGDFKSDPEQKDVLTAEFRDDPRYWFFVYPILVLPNPLRAGWFFLIRLLNRIDKAFGFVL